MGDAEKTEDTTVSAVPQYENSQGGNHDLKSIREARGISLHDIFLASRVSVVNLEAIENGRYDLLPTSFIAKSFIRIYARGVGIDPEALLRHYEEYLSSKGIRALGEDAVVLGRPTKSPIPYKLIGYVILTLVIIGLLASLLYWYYPSGSNKSDIQSSSNGQTAALSTPAVSENTAEPPVNSNPSPNTQIASGAVPSTTTSPTATTNMPYQLVIEAKGFSWVKIKEDRKTPFEILMKPGEKVERRASEVFELDIGNAGETNVFFQGKSLGNLGKQGEVVHLKLPLENAAPAN